MLDFARTFQIPATVFRMSSTYGPNQYGKEDQGWIAHFVLNAIKNKPLNIFGDGKQVRDILYIEDFIEALVLTQKNLNSVSGQVFNIGGGPENAVSLINVLEMIAKISKNKISIDYKPWREGEQRFYVSDIRKFELATGWVPKTDIVTGIEKMYNWLTRFKSTEINIPTVKENIG